jgi:hypothetical protein
MILQAHFYDGALPAGEGRRADAHAAFRKPNWAAQQSLLRRLLVDLSTMAAAPPSHDLVKAWRGQAMRRSVPGMKRSARAGAKPLPNALPPRRHTAHRDLCHWNDRHAAMGIDRRDQFPFGQVHDRSRS